MQSISWFSFGLSSAVTKTVIHFFPSAGNVSAPYPAVCKFTLFGEGARGRTITVEGPRLSQPDGVRLNDVFPDLDDSLPSYLGLEVGLSTVQPRIDLTSSRCIVELSSQAFSSRFCPPCLGDGRKRGNAHEEETGTKSGLLIQDAYSVASVVLVNNTASTLETKLLAAALSGRASAEEPAEVLRSDSTTPYSVRELDLGEGFFDRVAAQECSWGLVRSRSVWLEEPLPTGATCCIVHRHAVTRVPLSVSVL